MDQFEQIYKDAKDSARVMAISVHPYIMGAPHRAKYFRKIFEDIAQEEGRAVLERLADRRLVSQGRAESAAVMVMDSWSYRSAFVPHDIAAPVQGAASGPLAGLTFVVKDMYASPASASAAAIRRFSKHKHLRRSIAAVVQKLLDAGATHHRQDDLRRIFLQRQRQSIRITARR